MTATIHTLRRALPEDPRVVCAREVVADPDASINALANAASFLRHLGNGTTDQARALDAERRVIAHCDALRNPSRAPVRPRPSWWVIPAVLLGVIAWGAIAATITIGPEAWWTERNRNAVEAGE